MARLGREVIDREIDPARLRTLARAAGVRLPISIDGDEIGTVPRDAVLALLRVPGAVWTWRALERRIECRYPRGRVSLRVMSDQALEDWRKAHPKTRAEPADGYLPHERAEIAAAERRDVYGDHTHRDAVKSRIRRDQRYADRIREIGSRVEDLSELEPE